MQKRFWAIVIKQSLMGLSVVFLAGVMFDHYTNEPGYRSPLTTGMIALVLYIAVSALMGLLNLITSALYLWLFAEGDLSAAVVDDLHAMDILPPRSQDPKNYEYLAILADDESVKASDRVKAAALHATYQANMSKGLFRALALRKAIDAGVLRYYHEAPRLP
jgi:hypothetical protein